MNAPALYYPDALPFLNLHHVMDCLRSQVDWEVHDTHRREALFLRKPVPYYYAHDRGERPLFPQPEPHALQLLWREVEGVTGCRFEACFINHYLHGGGTLGWHSDDSPSIDQSRPVVILTLGATRPLEFRAKGTAGPVSTLYPSHGSLVAMKPGAQDTHQHQVPAYASGSGAERFSLVFRGLSGLVRG